MYNRHDFEDTNVIKNRSTFLEKLGTSLDQTIRLRVQYDRDDFCQYVEVDSTSAGNGMRDGKDVTIADALITKDKDLALLLPVADCVGAALYDPTHEILAIAHLGRHSLEQQGGTKIVQHLVNKYGSNASDIKVWLTPAPSKAAYKIWALENKGMKEATFEQLDAAGISKENIIDNTAETDTDLQYYSYSEFLKGNRTEDGDHAIVAFMKD